MGTGLPLALPELAPFALEVIHLFAGPLDPLIEARDCIRNFRDRCTTVGIDN